MPKSFPSNRLEEFGCLDAADIALIRAAGGPLLDLPQGSTIREEGTSDRAVYLLVEGWACSSFVLTDGQRQILKVHLPGDMLGSTSMCVDHAVDTVTALTRVSIRRLMLPTIGKLMAKSPRIATFMLLSAQKERIALMDRIAWIGRSNAVARMASFLVDLYGRLSLLGLLKGESFHLPMTQEQIGDVLGLTAVHVNRTLRQLDTAGLIHRNRTLIRFPDIARLEAAAALPGRRMSSDISWSVST